MLCQSIYSNSGALKDMRTVIRLVMKEIIDKLNTQAGPILSVSLRKSVSTSCCSDREGVNKGGRVDLNISLDYYVACA